MTDKVNFGEIIPQLDEMIPVLLDRRKTLAENYPRIAAELDSAALSLSRASEWAAHELAIRQGRERKYKLVNDGCGRWFIRHYSGSLYENRAYESEEQAKAVCDELNGAKLK